MPFPLRGFVARAAAVLDDRRFAVLARGWDQSREDDLDAYLAVIGLADADTGRLDVVYSYPGGLRDIAATYDSPLPDDPEELGPRTVVLTSSGEVIRHVTGVQIVPKGNTGWLDQATVVCDQVSEYGMPDFDLVEVDVPSGALHWLGAVRQHPLARVGHRYLYLAEMRAGDGPRLFSATLDGNDVAPFLAVREPSQIMHVDAASIQG